MQHPRTRSRSGGSGLEEIEERVERIEERVDEIGQEWEETSVGTHTAGEVEKEEEGIDANTRVDACCRPCLLCQSLEPLLVSAQKTTRMTALLSVAVALAESVTPSDARGSITRMHI